MHTDIHDGSEPDATNGSAADSSPRHGIVRDGVRRMPAAALWAEVAAHVTTSAAAR